MENQFHAQGHGEYREIFEEDFLKEVCGSKYVIVHFFHPEFFQCIVVDKHMKVRIPLLATPCPLPIGPAACMQLARPRSLCRPTSRCCFRFWRLNT